MSEVKVSLFASAIRSRLWPAFFKSLEGTSIEYEVSFAGNVEVKEIMDSMILPNLFNGKEIPFIYTHAHNIKPAQCYAIVSRHCTGETISWSCDDAEYKGDILGKAYAYWKAQNNEKLILSLQTKETGYKVPGGILQDMNQHCFFGMSPNTPLMAPMCLMSRKFFNDLGGIDQRYVCGQYENDLVMRAYSQGATVEIFGDEESHIFIDHLGKSIAIGESTDEESFLDRPFAKGYTQDRQILEASWCRLNVAKLHAVSGGRGHAEVKMADIYDISKVQLDEFQPYPQDIPLDKSLSNKGHWE